MLVQSCALNWIGYTSLGGGGGGGGGQGEGKREREELIEVALNHFRPPWSRLLTWTDIFNAIDGLRSSPFRGLPGVCAVYPAQQHPLPGRRQTQV